MRILIFFIAAAATLGACSSDKAPPPQAQAPQPAAKTVFDAQLKALDKAKAVQDVVDKQKAAADKKLEDDGG
jgi:hypothetical protein